MTVRIDETGEYLLLTAALLRAIKHHETLARKALLVEHTCRHWDMAARYRSLFEKIQRSGVTEDSR